ncbi:MAG: phosphatidylglycerol lysyltransferase domain-containing protein [Clostridia bacterium]|nr:phosphatidylglycerol lysyltransferase domain-containing protein [Clostridia bacterium]
MFEFRSPSIDDTEWLRDVLMQAQPESCEYTVGNILGWHSFYGAQIANIENCLVTKIKKNNLFGFPKGENKDKALETVFSEFDFPSFYGLTSDECDIIRARYPGEYVFYQSRNSFDYVYSVEKLAKLSGKKYHSKRNHISFFEKNFNWSYEAVTPENLRECIELNEQWYKNNLEKDPYGIDNERKVLDFAFKNYERLNYRGGLLRVDGKIIAFTFGEKLNDKTFDTHFEKALSSVRGAYPMINMMFAREGINDFEFVNREDDTGSEGLRKAKLSYHPEKMIEKFTAVKL